MVDEMIPGGIPPYTSYLDNCVQLWVFANAGPWNPEMKLAEPLKDYAALAAKYQSYQLLVDELTAELGRPPTYSDIVAVSNGIPPGPGTGGWGLAVGVEDVWGSEIWLTMVTGWDDGPKIQADSFEGQMIPGTLYPNVRGRGRDIVVSGSIINRTRPIGLQESKYGIGAGLATAPHRGWLHLDNLWLPVVLKGATKMEQVDACRIDFELTLSGRDGVSPGRGVYKEKWPASVISVVGNHSASFPRRADNRGPVGSPPVIEYRPVDGERGATLNVRAGGFIQQLWFETLLAGHYLRIDVGNRIVDLLPVDGSHHELIGSGNGRHLIDWSKSEWVEVPPGLSDWYMDFGDKGLSECTVTWNELG